MTLITTDAYVRSSCRGDEPRQAQEHTRETERDFYVEMECLSSVFDPGLYMSE